MTSWEDKQEMCRLANAMNRIPESINDSSERKAFQEFVLARYREFDAQAWDMFFTSIHLVPKTVAQDMLFYKELVPHIESFDQAMNDTFGLRTAFRIELLLTMYDDELKGLKDERPQ